MTDRTATLEGAPAARSYLLVRRQGNVWGVADAVVEGRLGSGGFRIRAGESAMAVDEILDVVAGLRVHPAGCALARWWPEPIAGLAIYRERPVLVIDPRHPPQALRDAPAAEARGKRGARRPAGRGGA